jgi:hypothetical protein
MGVIALLNPRRLRGAAEKQANEPSLIPKAQPHLMPGDQDVD